MVVAAPASSYEATRANPPSWVPEAVVPGPFPRSVGRSCRCWGSCWKGSFTATRAEIRCFSSQAVEIHSFWICFRSVFSICLHTSYCACRCLVPFLECGMIWISGWCERATFARVQQDSKPTNTRNILALVFMPQPMDTV